MVEIYGLSLTGICIFLFLIWLTLIGVAIDMEQVAKALQKENPMTHQQQEAKETAEAYLRSKQQPSRVAIQVLANTILELVKAK